MKKIAILISLLFNMFANAEECKCGYADLVHPLLPAVVNVTTMQKINLRERGHFPPGSIPEEFNNFLERFGLTPPNGQDYPEFDDEESSELKPYSAGSGFIIDKSGYIVTNHHVINDAEQITVTLHDDRKFSAKLIGSDSRTDLALLKIEHNGDLPHVNFGNSDDVRVGDMIVAIGNPFSLGGSVTTGVVSARSRDINAGVTSLVDNYIQTDAAINKGNSGGPMFNMQGEVIGINTFIYSPSGGNIGIGFAVPSSLAKPIIDQIKKSGKVVRGWLGVTIQSTEDVAEGLGIKDGKGALVVSVGKDSPADKYGISVGDIILQFDGQEITKTKKLPRIVAETPVGKIVKVTILSKGKKKTVSLKLGELDDVKVNDVIGDNKTVKGDYEKIMGLGVANITPVLRTKFKIAKDISGIVVLDTKRGITSRTGIKTGDVIVAVNQKPMTRVEDLKNVFESAKKEGKASAMMWIIRGSNNAFVQFPLK